MRYLGLDLGTKTIGLALSDVTGTIATSYKILKHENNPENCLDELLQIVEEKKITAFVLGYPKNMNNTLGPRAEATLAFQMKLKQATGLPVYLEDERLTTKQAEDTLILGNASRKKRKKVIDAVAATIILQEFLDKRRTANGRKESI